MLPAFRALLRAVEARFYAELPLVPPVLDLGCGDGYFAALAFDRALAAGCDPKRRMLAEARRLDAHGALVQADGAYLPYADGSFRTVVCNSVLEHVSGVEAVLAEVARVLAPPATDGQGGWFYVSVPGPNFSAFLSIGRALDRVGLPAWGNRYRRAMNRISRHHTCYAQEVWQRRLAAAGLQVVRAWPYFSRRALVALEWGHYLGLPAWVARVLAGRWILWPSRLNLWLTERVVRPIYEDENINPGEGAYVFFVARKMRQAGAVHGSA